MRSQTSVEMMTGMAVALSLALFLSMCVSGEAAAFARNEHALAGVANSMDYDIKCALGSFGSAGGVG